MTFYQPILLHTYSSFKYHQMAGVGWDRTKTNTKETVFRYCLKENITTENLESWIQTLNQLQTYSLDHAVQIRSRKYTFEMQI